MSIEQIARSLRRIAVLCSLAVVLGIASEASATITTIGSGILAGPTAGISGESQGTIVPVDADGGTPPSSAEFDSATLEWTVESSDSGEFGGFTFRYTYVWTDAQEFSGNLSHLVIEVSDNFESSDGTFFQCEGSGCTPTSITGEIGEDPTSPEGEDTGGFDITKDGLFGVKFNIDCNDSASEPCTYVILTDRTPIWGDFWVKDGVQGDLNAFNLGYFDLDPDITATGLGLITGVNATGCVVSGSGSDACLFGFLAVPDTDSGKPPGDVPEPATLLLFGIGLLGLGGFARRRRKVAA